MKTRKTWGIICIILGATMLFFSHYISEQVASGRIEIQQGKRAVQSTESLFGASKYTKPIGEEVTRSGRQKISAGEHEIVKYTTISRNLKIGGIVLILIGVGLIFMSRRKNK